MSFIKPIDADKYNASYIIYPKDNIYYAKACKTGGLNYSNINAASVIQYALNNLTASRTEKEVIILKGNFTINTRIDFVSNVKFYINGAITFTDNTNDDLFLLNGVSNVEIINGIINMGSQTDPDFGIQITNSNNIKVYNLTINNARLGFIVRANCDNVIISRCKAYNCAFQGFNLSGTNNKLIDSIVDSGCSEFGVVAGGQNCKFLRNRLLNLGGTAAFEIGYYNDGLQVVGNIIKDNITTAGFYVLPKPTPSFDAITNCLVKDNYVIVSGTGKDAFYATRTAFTEYPIFDMIIKSNYFKSINRNAISVSANGGPTGTLNRIIITENILEAEVSAHAILTEGRDIIITKNIIKSGDIANGGSQPRVYIYENIGYVTENSGTASVANAGTIAHGCVSTPKVQITVNESTPIPVSYTVDATNITVYHSSEGSVTVSWRAEV